MSTIAHILDSKGHDVVKIDSEAKVIDAANLMNKHHIGAVVVTQSEKVIGIFSERDILNRVVAQNRDPAELYVREVMTAPVACCGPDTSRAECRSVMKNRRVRHLPVVKDGRLIGIISIGDILEDEGAEQQATIRNLYEYINVDWNAASESNPSAEK